MCRRSLSSISGVDSLIRFSPPIPSGLSSAPDATPGKPGRRSANTYLALVEPFGHVGENDAVADVQAFLDLDVARRDASELDGDSSRSAAALVEHEKLGRLRVVAHLRRPFEDQRLGRPVDFDAHGHGEVRTQPGHLVVDERDVDRDEAVAYRRLDARDLAVGRPASHLEAGGLPG